MENLGWGFQMTVLGMGLVFTLLALLWVLLTVVLKLDKEEKEEEAPAASVAAAADEAESVAEEAEDAVGAQASEESQTVVDGMAADLIAAVMVAALKHKLTLRSEAAPAVRTNWPGSQPSRWAAAGRVRQTNTWTPRG